MPKLAWNDFMEAHKDWAAFAAGVRASLPPKMRFGKDGKERPTPYGLFIEWGELTLKGDWATTKAKGGFFLAVATEQDANLIIAKFPATAPKMNPVLKRLVTGIGYRDSSYVPLARALGHDI
jgi:hypothetical protein